MSNFVPAGVARGFSEMILRRSILLLVYGVGARSDVTEGVWTAVEKGGAAVPLNGSGCFSAPRP
jgi:hypothetical protein